VGLKMKKIYILLLVVALVCTREQAIQKALYQAVAQAKGIAVSSGR
jgi:hypothetical protein